MRKTRGGQERGQRGRQGRLGGKRKRLEKMLFIVHERRGIYTRVWGSWSARRKVKQIRVKGWMVECQNAVAL
jgi:hypothetical protein